MEQAGTLQIGAERFIGQPIFVAPDDLGLDVIRQGVDEHFFPQIDLSHVLAADEHLHADIAHQRGDGGAVRGVVMLFHLFVALVLDLVEGPALLDRPEWGPAVARNTAHELALFKSAIREEFGRDRIIAQVGHAECAVGSEGHYRAFNALVLRHLEGDRFTEVAEFGAAEQLDGRGRGAEERDAVYAVGLAGLLAPPGHVSLPAEAGG